MHRVLIAEDDPAIRLLYRSWLEGDGYDVRVASDGREAIMLLELERLPDAAVLDVDMPYVDGLSVCRHLRLRGIDLPIVVVSGLQGIAPTARAAGASAVLTKPCSREDLLAVLATPETAPRSRAGPRAAPAPASRSAARARA